MTECNAIYQTRYKYNNHRNSALRPQIQSLRVAVAGKSALIEEKSAKSAFIMPAQEVGRGRGRGEGEAKSENWPMAEIQYDRRFTYTNILPGMPVKTETDTAPTSPS